MNTIDDAAAAAFIDRWKKSEAAEQANSQLFLGELCKLLQVPPPDPAVQDEAQNNYVFEKRVEFQEGDGTTSLGRIDLYRAGCFVLESKQGSEQKSPEPPLSTALQSKKRRTGTAARGAGAWGQAMTRARHQAERYARALPVSAGWPPFLVVVDVGYCFDLYADFAQAGKGYTPFPDPQNFRIRLDDLARPETRETLRALWLDPLSLDPSRVTARVTRELADRLARLAKSLEAEHPPETVAAFLIRCLFTMFAEDVELLPRDSFLHLLERAREKPAMFTAWLEELWRAMNEGKISTSIGEKLLRFNGGLFADCTALPVNADQCELLIEAAQAQWTDVEPAIFGTLLERALDPHERHKLGAHYTPRAYVERLVMPTVIEPLRAQWQSVYASAVQLESEDKIAEARDALQQFHDHLCEVRVLDPACGSGNFLYVAMQHMKLLEGEVINAIRQFGDAPTIHTVKPHQFLGIEVNPRAAAIAESVLWIGYLQLQARARGKEGWVEPILDNDHNIECRDAVLAWDAVEDVVDEAGNPITRWDGRTTKPHPVTGEEVPDETARVVEQRYINPRKAEWPKADYIVGNPPFLGKGEKMRAYLGDGYVHALRDTYSEVPGGCDFVMYWWHKAAELVRSGAAKQFGLITTNSMKQTFNRRVLEPHLDAKSPLSISFAIPDHPWVDSADGAAVRISMTTGVAGHQPGTLFLLEDKDDADSSLIEIRGPIRANLNIGADVASTEPLLANANISSNGVMIRGAGFIVTAEEAQTLGLGTMVSLERHIRPYCNGRDMAQSSRESLVIDLWDLTIDEVRTKYPAVFQWIFDRVKPERDASRDRGFRENWWVFGRPRPAFREAMRGVRRFIATPETAKHRFFVFLDAAVLPDHKLIAIALEDAFFLGVLSSSIHVKWALATGSTLEDRPVYPKSVCFAPFPFPDCTEAQKQRIRELGEQLDGHRKARQALYPGLTMTGMYNVLEKLRDGAALSAKEREIHEQGLVSVLRQLHDELDAAVAAAYGWPADLAEEEILERLVALNAERAAEEARGLVRWLRPEFQNLQGAAATQHELTIAAETPIAATTKLAKQRWPAALPERFQAVRATLEQVAAPASSDEIAARFTRARRSDIAELLDTLVLIGQARRLDDGRYAA